MKTKKWIVNCIAFCAAAVLILIDQLTKKHFEATIPQNGDITLINKVLKIVYVRNTGAAWGMFSNLTPVLTVVSCLVLIAVIVLFARLDWNEKKFRPIMIIFVFVAAGAVGNLIDRIFLKYVIDFIYIELINFPVFNIADCYITISMIVLMILLLFYYKDGDFDRIFGKDKKEDGERGTDNS